MLFTYFLLRFVYLYLTWMEQVTHVFFANDDLTQKVTTSPDKQIQVHSLKLT